MPSIDNTLYGQINLVPQSIIPTKVTDTYAPGTKRLYLDASGNLMMLDPYYYSRYGDSPIAITSSSSGQGEYTIYVGSRTTLAGTIAINGTAITGTETTFQTDLVVGDWIYTVSSWCKVATITSQTEMTLEKPPRYNTSDVSYGKYLAGSDSNNGLTITNALATLDYLDNVINSLNLDENSYLALVLAPPAVSASTLYLEGINGYIRIGNTELSSISIHSCKDISFGHVGVAEGFEIRDGQNAYLSYCYGTAGYSGNRFYMQYIYRACISDCDTGICLNSIYASDVLDLLSLGNTGTATNYGLYASGQTIICKSGTQPTGTNSNQHTEFGAQILPEKTYGTTAERPTNAFTGDSYLDTTLNKPIIKSGTVWIDSTGATV